MNIEGKWNRVFIKGLDYGFCNFSALKAVMLKGKVLFFQFNKHVRLSILGVADYILNFMKSKLFCIDFIGLNLRESQKVLALNSRA